MGNFFNVNHAPLIAALFPGVHAIHFMKGKRYTEWGSLLVQGDARNRHSFYVGVMDNLGTFVPLYGALTSGWSGESLALTGGDGTTQFDLRLWWNGRGISGTLNRRDVGAWGYPLPVVVS